MSRITFWRMCVNDIYPFVLQSISSILPFATKMESKLRDGTWTPVMRCPRGTPPTSHQGEATPPILLPLAPTGHRHSPHNRIQAAGIILMVRFQDFCSSTTLKSWLKYNLSFQDPYPLVRQTPGSPMLTRHPRTTRMTKIVFTVIVMPWVSNIRISVSLWKIAEKFAFQLSINSRQIARF